MASSGENLFSTSSPGSSVVRQGNQQPRVQRNWTGLGHDQRMQTVRERVLKALRLATHPLDDDELSGPLNIHPRQTVNQATRKLEREGLIRRVSGPDGKLVNVLADDAGVSAPVVS